MAENTDLNRQDRSELPEPLHEGIDSTSGSARRLNEFLFERLAKLLPIVY